MTANQRRSGFRLPWSSDGDETERPAEAAPTAAAGDAGAPSNGTAATAPPASDPKEPPAAARTEPAAAPPAPAASFRGSVTTEPEPEPAEPDAGRAGAPPPAEFLRDLIAAMRRVADEARQAGITQLRTEAEDAVRALDADAEKRRDELRTRAEADVAGVGEWARAEAERIKKEAEERVASRRAQLEQQLAADQTRTEAETKALRSRVDDYERELDAYHAQLAEITDPAAFAAAAKRMPAPPPLVAASPSTPAKAPAATAPPPATVPAASAPSTPADADKPAEGEVHPAEEEVLAARLAELDEKLAAPPEGATASGADAPAAVPGEETTTDIVVKGLGSFGAITGFRQSLASQEGISGVALSLGQTGEFVFRATHAGGVDVRSAIVALEGDGATIEPRPEGGLRVTLERAR